MLLALPEQHPLAGLAALTPADLADQEWIGVSTRRTPLRHDFRGRLHPRRLHAGCAHGSHRAAHCAGLVAAGLGIAMIQKGLSHNAPPGVVLREVPWISIHPPLWAAWHRINLRPLVETFRSI
jgi:DNA-binding transcriptional LysR family regulator